jgi:hypothetical protein
MFRANNSNMSSVRLELLLRPPQRFGVAAACQFFRMDPAARQEFFDFDASEGIISVASMCKHVTIPQGEFLF